MDQVFAFERDAYLKHLRTRVLHQGEAGGRPCVVLEDTLFYPEGGGQPSDRGSLGGHAVQEVRKTGDGICHILGEPLPEVGEVLLQLDWDRRFDHMQQHTAQHLLTALAQDRFGWATTAFHLGEHTCDIELDTPSLDAEALALLELDLAKAVREARPVRTRRVSPEAYAQETVRSRGLPEGHVGSIRLVEIEGVDTNTCGGTHVASTAELEVVKLLGTEPIRGGTRLFYVAGGRVRARMEAHERRNLALRTHLGAPDEALVETLLAKLDQLKGAERQVRHLEHQLVEALVQGMEAQPSGLVDRHLEGRDGAFLQKVARQLVDRDPTRLLFLTSESSGQGWFVLAAGQGVGLDVAEAGRELAPCLEARGGGSKGIFQGKVGRLEGRAQALELLSQRMRERTQ